MHRHELPGIGIAQVWLSDLPAATLTPRRLLKDRVDHASPNATAAEGQVAIELVAPSGARIQYGLLGATFKPSAIGGTDIVVWQTDSVDDGPFASTITRADQPKVGLPSEFAAYVLYGAAEANLGSLIGTLTFDRAAFTDVGSSAALFRRLARAVVGVLATPLVARDPSRLSALLRAPKPV
jgi:hypothetical protein